MTATPPLLMIEWIDCRQPTPGWQRLADLEDRQQRTCISVGFLVREDAQTKVIAPNLGNAEHHPGWEEAAGLISIPAAAITKISQLNPLLATPPKSLAALGAAWPRPLSEANWLRRLS